MSKQDNQQDTSRRSFLAATGTVIAAGALPSLAKGMQTRVDIELPTNATDLCFTSPSQLAALIKSRRLSAVEVMTAYLDRIDTINPHINAIVSQIPRENALAQAEEADKAVVRGDDLGVFHGLPIAIKDTADVKGMPTTVGSRLLKDNIAKKDSLFVSRLREAGMLFIGKTNVPDFAGGSHTVNKLFGATRNPYNLGKSAGGSSGGAAAALAAGLMPVADGSDLGGSIRNPGSFNNLVGLRPSVGRVPSVREHGWQSQLAVEGPIGRTVRDTADMLAVMAGPDARDPLSIMEPGDQFRRELGRDFKGSKIAWAGDLGQLTVDSEVLKICQTAMSRFEELGCNVEAAYPDVSGGMESFQVDRAFVFAGLSKMVPRSKWDILPAHIIWNIEKGLKLTIDDFLYASKLRTAVYHRIIDFLTRYDFIALPTSQVPAFDIELDWVREINGQKMETYIDWMASCCIMSTTQLPAISVPCGFTRAGLPVGLQIVGGYKKDFDVLQIAHAFEQVTGYGKIRPEVIGSV